MTASPFRTLRSCLPSTSRARQAVVALLAAVSLPLVSFAAPAHAAQAPSPQVDASSTAAADDGWYTSWAQSQQRISTKTFTNMSMRIVTHLTQGGDKVRIRLQNEFGTGAVLLDRTAVAISTGGAGIVAGTNRPLTFGGSQSVSIPVGAEVWSDPVDLDVLAQQDLAVSFFLSGSPKLSLHELAGRDNYATPNGAGNKIDELSGDSFNAGDMRYTYMVSAVDVYNTDLAGTVVAYGSSVVDGVGSDNCGSGCSAFGQNKRWVDDVARRVVGELPAGRQYALVNEGISGTTSSPRCAGGATDGVSRLDRDVLALTGVTAVIFYYGTNDLANGCSADVILASFRSTFQRLRDAGIKVFVTPVTPRPGYTADMNAFRATINAFVRAGGSCSGTCDGILDFDTVLKDPANANSINPLYDNGDGIHANVVGQQAIADSVDLDLLASAAAPTFTSTAPPGTVVGAPYDFTFTATGHPAPTYAVTSGALPSGLSLDAATGHLSGVATTALASTFTVTASNSAGPSDSVSCTIHVSPVAVAPRITSSAPPAAAIRSPYGFTVRASGYPAPRFAVTTGTLPAGLSLDPATGAITGVPTAPGSSTFTVTASNGTGADAKAGYTITVGPALSTVTARAATVAPRYGATSRVTVTVHSSGAAPTGTVTVRSAGKVLASGTLAAPVGASRDGVLTLTTAGRALAPGKHVLTVAYAGDANVRPSSTSLTLQVAKAVAKITPKAPKKVTTAGRATVTVRVAAAGVPKVGGTAAVYDGKRKVGSAKVSASGKATVKVKKLKAGKHHLVVRYKGTSTVGASSSKKLSVTVKRG